MAKRLMLYMPIWSDIASEYIEAMEEDVDEDVSVRINSPGGSVFAGNGMLAVTSEHKGHVTMKVDGSAASMGAFLLFYADRVEANDLSRIMIHRADGWVDTPEEQALLDGINKDLKAQMKKRLDAGKFKDITGYTIEDIFDPTRRVEVWLTAKQAKNIGLVHKVNRLQPAEMQAMGRIVAHANFEAGVGESEGGQQQGEQVDYFKVVQAISIGNH